MLTLSSMSGATHVWGMSVLLNPPGPSSLWLTSYIDDLSSFCSTSAGRIVVVDDLPTTTDEGGDLVARHRPSADVVALLVPTDDQPLLQNVIVAGFEPFARVASPDGDRFLFFSRTSSYIFQWPDLEVAEVRSAPVAA